jgi:DnaJ family protein C protein 11
LSHDVLPSAIFYGTVTPIAVYYIVKKLIVEPYVSNQNKK